MEISKSKKKRYSGSFDRSNVSKQSMMVYQSSQDDFKKDFIKDLIIRNEGYSD